jgi:hypothetical protein
MFNPSRRLVAMMVTATFGLVGATAPAALASHGSDDPAPHHHVGDDPAGHHHRGGDRDRDRGGEHHRGGDRDRGGDHHRGGSDDGRHHR